MADLDRIKRNVEKMSTMGAPVEDIDGYIASEGATVEQIRQHKTGGVIRPPLADGGDRVGSFAMQKPKDGGGFTSQFFGNIPTGVAGTLDTAEMVLPPQMISGLARRLVGVPSPKEQWESSPFAPSKPVTSEEKLGATLGDFVGGTIVPGAGWIGAARNMAAAGAQPALSRIGQFVQRAAEETAKHPYKAAGFDLASALTGGTAKHSAEEAGYGPVGQSVAALAGGMVPAAPSLIGATPLGTLGRYMTGRGQGARNALAEQQAMWDEAGVRQFGPAMVDNPVYKATGQGGAGSVFGGPLRREAQGAIDDTLTQARRVIARGTDGAPPNDLGEVIQSDLRRAFNERKNVSGLPNEEIERLTGPIGPGGFMPPRKIVDPVRIDRPPPPGPRTVDPAEIDIPPVNPPELPKPVKGSDYTPLEHVQPSAEAVRQYREPFLREQQTVKYYEGELKRLKDAFEARARSLNRNPGEVFGEIDAMAKKGDKRHMLNDDYENLTSAYRELEASRGRLQSIKNALDEDRDLSHFHIRQQEEAAHNAKFKEETARYNEQTEQARKVAEAETQRRRTAALQERQRTAQEEADNLAGAQRDRIARVEGYLTGRRQRSADRQWESEIANSPGFQLGRSRESYPTEFAAAYERVGRILPNEPFNPMGGASLEGRSAKTSVKSLLSEFADDARASFAIRGSGFNDAGEMEGEFRKYLQGVLGAGIANRLAALSKARPGHAGTMPEALRDFRTMIRKETEDAERYLLPGEIRRSDAASLRRLHGALEDDIYNFTKRSGGPAERFETETGRGVYVQRDGELNRSTQIGDAKPSDMTIYVKPEHLDRLTGSSMPADHKGRMSAARSFEVDGSGIMLRNNATGEADRATRVPYSFKPEIGMRPVQMWDDGGISFGSKIVSRDMSPGELSAEMTRNVNRAYGQHVEELRKPLAKLFGKNVEPIQAMDRITKAAVDGDLRTLRAFMRVMDEKADPHKATAAIFAHLTDNAPTLEKFIQGVSKLNPDALKVLTRGDGATAMIRDLQRLQGIASRLQPYEKAMSGGVRFNGRGPDLTNPANIALGLTMASNVFASVFAVGGAAAVSRFMASPRYLSWMTQTAKLQRQPQIAAHVARLSRMVQQDEEKGWLSPKTGQAIKNAMSMGAHAMTTGNQDEHPYQGVFDAAKSKGVDYKNADPQDVMDAAWAANPTDSMGEMLDAMAKSLGIPPPWERKK